MKTKLFSLFLMLAASIGSIYADSVKIGDLYYYLNAGDKTASVAEYPFGREYSRDITIPASVTFNAETYSVTSIVDYAFYRCSSLTSIEIPNSVTSIGVCAFEECTGLKSVTIPNSVTSIGPNAFNGCTSLESVTVPNSVTSIGFNAFFGCTSLPVINNLRYADTYLVEAVDQTLTSYTIKEGTKWIGDGAFYNCSNLTSITIPNSVTSIGDGAFYNCSNLTSITIPNSVTSIGEYAFQNCTSLPVINNLRYADTYLVGAVDKKLTTYTIKEGTIWIGDEAFDNCKGLTSVAIPNSVIRIGYEAFEGCKGLTSVTIPNSVTSIGAYAFKGCTGLTSIGVSTNNPNYSSQDGVLFDKGKTTLIQYPGGKRDAYTIPNSVTRITESAFYGCTGLTSVTIPNSVTSIGEWAFYYCTGLTSVTIGNSVTMLIFATFTHCSNLASVTCYATIPPAVSENVFDYVNCSRIPLYVPQESIDAYKAAYQWKEFNPILPIKNPEGVDNVNSSVKQNTSKLIRDGKVYILHGDKTYTLTGQDVK